MQRVNFKLPDNVYHTMTFKAKALGINNTTYIKTLIMDTKIVSADTHKDYTRTLGLLGNLTGNINQIAATLNVAHNEGNLNAIDYEMMINMLTMILKNAEVCTGD
jgi:hypothetical protein